MNSTDKTCGAMSAIDPEENYAMHTSSSVEGMSTSSSTEFSSTKKYYRDASRR